MRGGTKREIGDGATHCTCREVCGGAVHGTGGRNHGGAGHGTRGVNRGQNERTFLGRATHGAGCNVHAEGETGGQAQVGAPRGTRWRSPSGPYTERGVKRAAVAAHITKQKVRGGAVYLTGGQTQGRCCTRKEGGGAGRGRTRSGGIRARPGRGQSRRECSRPAVRNERDGARPGRAHHGG